MEDQWTEAQQVDQQEAACKNCGATLKYAPGTVALACDHCGTENEFESAQEPIREIDFKEFLSNGMSTAVKAEVLTIKCNNCGADTSFEENQTAGDCAFCGSPLVATNAQAHSLIKPESLLPFQIDQSTAFGHFGKWIKSLWFAPNDLAKYARSEGKLTGIYLPYWTYDCDTSTVYTGQRGINYTDTETYTTTEDGKSVTRTRTVTKTRWYFVSGRVSNIFDDVLVLASHSLQEKYVDKLEPWGLENLVSFDDKYLTGFKAESYQVPLEDGFGTAKEKMDPTIRRTIERQIGGDQQRISTLHTSYADITFKHILLPVYVSAYQYNNKTYQIMVNGATGEVTGERPWSWIKIALAVIAGILVLLALFFVFSS